MQSGQRVYRRRMFGLVGQQRARYPWRGVVEPLHELGSSGAHRLPPAGEPDGHGAYRLVVTSDRQQEDRARAVPPIRHRATERVSLGHQGVQAAIRYPSELAFRGQKAVEEPPVAST